MDRNRFELDDDALESAIKNRDQNAIAEYAARTLTLHRNLIDRDRALENAETVLSTCQKDLRKVTREIAGLQQTSIATARRLRDRRSAEGLADRLIEDDVVPETLVSAIARGAVTDDRFPANLTALNYKILLFDGQKSKSDAKDAIDRLKAVAATKIRRFILEQINKFKNPKTNYFVPQNTLYEYKFLYEFLLTHDSSSARQVSDEYVGALSRVYYAYFKSYSGLLRESRRAGAAATKDDLLAAEGPTSGPRVRKSFKKYTVFTMGNRAAVLDEIERPIAIPHQIGSRNLSFETVFRSVQYALADNACREYKFVCEFFQAYRSTARELFSKILGSTLGLLTEHLERFVENCYDAFALLLCGRLIVRYRVLCRNRSVPVLARYWDTLLATVGTRFGFVLERHVRSVRNYDTTEFDREKKPHFVVRRYAEFVSDIVSFSENVELREPQLVRSLTEEVLGLVLRLAAVFGSRKDRLVFLINNYDLALSVLLKRVGSGSFEARRFREELSARREDYIDEVLGVCFGGMMEFARDAENGRGAASDSRQSELVETFASTWEKSLERINNEILPSFHDLTTGASLSRLAFSRLIEYYRRFQKALSAPNKARSPEVHEIVAEIEKYKANYLQ